MKRWRSYRINKFAFILGEKLFPNKKDSIINALQLENESNDNESQSLASAYIESTFKRLKELDISLLIINKDRIKLKTILLATWIIVIITFSFNYQISSKSYYRWSNPNKTFLAPKPFALISTTGSLHILGGEKPNISIKASSIISDTVVLKLVPTQVSTQKRDSLTLTFSHPSTENGEFHFELPELYQDYSYQALVNAKHFWESWENVTTAPETIFVTDRPSFETFLTTITPPKYSRLENLTQEGNIAAIKGLKGSEILIEVTSNRPLQTAYLNLNDKKINMVNSYDSASGGFTLLEEGQFTVNLVDKRGITNRDPIAYSLEILPDNFPILNVIKPAPIIELGNNQIIPIHLDIIDDFGFTDLQLAYEIRKPAYLQDDSFVAMFTINELLPDSIIQSVQMLWEVGDMFLMPDDEIHFHFELTDNDNISGPKKTISNTFIARVPSLTDLFENIADSEEEFFDNMTQEFENIQDIKEEFESLELKMLKEEELNWDQKNLYRMQLKMQEKN